MSSLTALKHQIKDLALENGFQQLSVADIDTSHYFPQFSQWVNDKLHGSMSFLERNQQLRQQPQLLHPGTCRVLSLRYNYLPKSSGFSKVLDDPDCANISRYALGRDYHKLMRKKLKNLAESIGKLCTNNESLGNFDYRVLVDSAPVLETAFAEKSGLGWKGKHTLVINESAGSWFFLGEIFINLPLEIDIPVKNQCASCTACMSICPTDAIVAPYKVDARKCISYLTIENKGPIPLEFRQAIGNRIYGCDDCQLICPWNRYSQISKELDFSVRNNLDYISLLELFSWTEQEFLEKLKGSPIRRIGYQSWQRNIVVALGNGNSNSEVLEALIERKEKVSHMVDEHIEWAINQLEKRKNQVDKVAPPTNNIKLIRSIIKMMPRDA